MRSGNSRSHPGNFSMSKHPAWISMLFIFMMSFIFQGCVVHTDHRGHRRHTGPVAVPAPITFTFTDHHRHSVRSYYNEHPRHHGKKHKKNKWKNKGRGRGRDHMPPGLAKRDVLPPGIQMQAVPVDLVRQLPHPPHGTRYTYHDDQVLLIDLNTRVVLDFINISVSAGY